VFLNLLALAFALSLDNFRTSIALGTQRMSVRRSGQVALVFGFWDGVAPLVGVLLGRLFGRAIGPIAGFVGPAVLGIYGLYLVLRAMRDPAPESVDDPWVTLFGLPFSLSLDNVLGGTTLGLLGYSPWFSALVCGLVTALMSFAALQIGRVAAKLIRIRADLLSGIALLVMAVVLVLDSD
jgi:putative Mn2+ efflux pump MntP